MIKKRSNHRERIKRGVIKGYSDRARMICEEQYLEEELRNVEEIFLENGYTRKEVRKAMKYPRPQFHIYIFSRFDISLIFDI